MKISLMLGTGGVFEGCASVGAGASGRPGNPDRKFYLVVDVLATGPDDGAPCLKVDELITATLADQS